jgi:hypothetical protein
MTLTAAAFVDRIRANPFNAELLERLPDLGLPQCNLVAGCLFQTVWNLESNRDPAADIRDYDVFYFDSSDLSWDAEDIAIRRADALLGDLPIRIELRNQARVHLWYEAKFGGAYPALASATDGIDRYLVACTCVGIDAVTGTLHAPDSLDDLQAGRLRLNPRNPRPDLFLAKAADYRARWPWLTILD